MDAARIERIETGVERGAAALFAAAVGCAAYGVLGLLGFTSSLGLCAAGAGALAYLPCSRILGTAGARGASFELPPFELRSLDQFDAADELLLMDADRLHSPEELLLSDADRLHGSEPLLLDDVLVEIGPDARVVRLFDRKSMPVHRGDALPVEPQDAAHALSEALAELRRSLA